MSTDDELRRLFQDAEPPATPADPDALVDALTARIEAKMAAGQDAPADADAAAAPATDAVPVTAAPSAPARSWWRTATWVGGAIAGGVVLGLVLHACGVGPGAGAASPSPSPTPSASPSPSPSASPSPSPSPSPEPSPSPPPSPSPSPSPTPEPPPQTSDPAPPPPPPDTTAPTITLTSAIDDIWEQHDVCGPNTLPVEALIKDDRRVTSAGIRYTAGSAAEAKHGMSKAGGNTWTGSVGPIAPDSVAHDFDPTDVVVTLWARDAAGNTSSIEFVVPVRSAWACVPG